MRQLSAAGLAVLLLHHPGKGARPAGSAARGSGALPAFVDVLLEMDGVERRDETDRRPRLLAFSRLSQTPRSLVFELNAEGTDYTACVDAALAEFMAGWDQLRSVLEEVPRRLTRRQIMEDWPDDYDPPGGMTLWTWLRREVHLGLVFCKGTGTKKDPFRYWLPEQEAKWRADPNYCPELEDMLDTVR